MRPIRLALVILLVASLILAAGSQRYAETGLGEAAAMLAVGRGVSQQYHDLLLAALARAEQAYGDSYGRDCHTALNVLRSASQHARAAAQELMTRAPADTKTASFLDKGYRHMAAQLSALVEDVKCRCKLPADADDSKMVWDRYYEGGGGHGVPDLP